MALPAALVQPLGSYLWAALLRCLMALSLHQALAFPHVHLKDIPTIREQKQLAVVFHTWVKSTLGENSHSAIPASVRQSLVFANLMILPQRGAHPFEGNRQFWNGTAGGHSAGLWSSLQLHHKAGDELLAGVNAEPGFQP